MTGIVSAYTDDPEDPLFTSELIGAWTGTSGVAVPAELVGSYKKNQNPAMSCDVAGLKHTRQNKKVAGGRAAKPPE